MEKSATSEKVRNHIPHDFAFSIMSKLPIKSLKRFGCVHKFWALLFENPDFMNIFRNNLISKHHSYYDDTSLLLNRTIRNRLVHGPFPWDVSMYSLSGERFEKRVKLNWPNPFNEDVPFFYILDSGSITGILCLYQRAEKVVLWNSATEEFKVIPPSPAVESAPPYLYRFVQLHGCGYDRVRDDYKLIRHVNSIKTNFDAVALEDRIFYYPFWEIYSLRSNSWKKLDVDMPHCRDLSVEGERLYMDGMYHWWGQDKSKTHNDKGAYLVSSFDLSNEVFFTTHIPLDILSNIDDTFDFDLMMLHLVVLNGSIGLISFYFGTPIFHISILGELGVKESWIKLFVVGPLPGIEQPIGAGKKGDIFFKRKDGELVWFNLSTQMVEELGTKGESYYCQIVIYKESHLPIEGINN